MKKRLSDVGGAAARGSASVIEPDFVTDADAGFDLKGNRWNLLKAIVNPRVSRITIKLCKAKIYIGTKPMPNTVVSHGHRDKPL